MKKLLVLTDAGEEVDDEAALWLLAQHLRVNPRIEADVVFVTGNTTQRAMRWAGIINSLSTTGGGPGFAERLHYFKGPESDRHMRYQLDVDQDELRRAGFGDIDNNFFDGGTYDGVVQLSPLGGFDDNFQQPSAGVEGALSRVFPRTGGEGMPIYLIVGTEGATNFPADSLHKNFKKHLQDIGFNCVHVEKKNYMNWEKSYFETMPPKLVSLVLEDEWNKAVGRIPPFAATLFVRFRVNTLVNYDVVEKAFASFENDHREDEEFVAATAWWKEMRDVVQAMIMEGYISKSRASDDKKGEAAYGNAKICDTIKGMTITWESVMSREFLRDISSNQVNGKRTSINSMFNPTVDEVMGIAVLMMTSKLLRMYAFNAYVTGHAPERMQIEPYLKGTADSPPLDFHNFPPLLGDITVIQQEVVGNPMYDPAGMLISLLLLSCNQYQAKQIKAKLDYPESLLDAEGRTHAMQAAYNGETPAKMVQRFLAPNRRTDNNQRGRLGEVPRLLVLTDACEEADNEAALWLLMKALSATNSFQADVVFVTGKPLRRAMRWARILNSLGSARPAVNVGAITYFIGPETPKPMRYQISRNMNELSAAGLGGLGESYFNGGAYDIVLQLSPLTGFSEDFSPELPGCIAALGRIKVREGAQHPLYLVLGEEGMHNSPRDALHVGFREFMQKQGFNVAHVTNTNHVHWDRQYFGAMPDRLVTLIQDDEWNKVLGRISPQMSNLALRFRVNTAINYDVVHKAYAFFEHSHQTHVNFSKAQEWWEGIADDVEESIKQDYIKMSRKADFSKGGAAYSNPKIMSNIRGQTITWFSTMSKVCIQDIEDNCQVSSEDLQSMTVDEVMGKALLLTTGKLLRIYAYDQLCSDRHPNRTQVMLYVTGFKGTLPMDFYSFPRFFNDITSIKNEVLGNPMYDPACMLFALAAFAASPAERKSLVDALVQGRSIMDQARRAEAMLAAFHGAHPSTLATLFFPLSQYDKLEAI